MRTLLRHAKSGPVQAGLVLTLAVMLAFAPDHFLPMLARAFLLQWSLFFAVLLVSGIALRRWWLAGSAALAVLLVMMPSTIKREPSPQGNGAPALRVAQLNVLQPNTAHSDVLKTAKATHADVISVQEVDARWARALEEGLSDAYPYHRIVPGTNCYGIALFSKRPFTRCDVLDLAGRPAIDAEVRTDKGPVRILAVHASSPGSYGEFRDRNRQLEQLAALVQASDVPPVVIGDLNTVSWDTALRRFCSRTGSHEGTDAPLATWPAVGGLALIPLDHVLVPPAWSITDTHTFPIPGSDHRGLVADLVRRS